MKLGWIDLANKILEKYSESKIRKEVLWTMSNISVEPGHQGLQVLANPKMVQNILQSIKDKNENPQIKKESIYAFANMSIKEHPDALTFALGEESLQIMFNVIEDDSLSMEARSAMTEAFFNILETKIFPEIVKLFLKYFLVKGEFLLQY